MSLQPHAEPADGMPEPVHGSIPFNVDALWTDVTERTPCGTAFKRPWLCQASKALELGIQLIDRQALVALLMLHPQHAASGGIKNMKTTCRDEILPNTSFGCSMPEKKLTCMSAQYMSAQTDGNKHNDQADRELSNNA
jgi:hypothetical protein